MCCKIMCSILLGMNEYWKLENNLHELCQGEVDRFTQVDDGLVDLLQPCIIRLKQARD